MSVVISKHSECHHSIGSPMDWAHPGPKTDRDHIMKDNLGNYCLKTFETRKEAVVGGLRSSVAEYCSLSQRPRARFSAAPLSFPLLFQR